MKVSIKKKRVLGFTLVEMLATILVLLVIFAIATPSIRRMLNKTNEVSQEYIENIVIDAAKEYAVVNNKTITSKLKVVGDTNVISLPTLMNMGLIEEEDLDKLGEDARVLLTLKENNDIDYSIVYDNTLVENTASRLILIGGNPLYVKQGTTYLEPGYVAYNRDGKVVTNTVVVSGTVNTAVIGTYQITYRLTDEIGNVEEEIRTVIVVDSTRPIVSVAVVTSNNVHNNKYAKNGEIVTLNITFSKDVTDPKVTIGKRQATVTGSGASRVATLTIPNDETTLVNKALEININDYIDIHENVGEEQTNVTSGGLVVFDNIKPVIISSSIVSNNTNNKLVKNNETITMTTTFSEPIINPITRIGGRATTISGTTTSTITSNYLIPSAEATLAQGNIEGTISSYMDRAGNFGISNDIKLSGGTVYYDRTSPVCVSSGGSSTWRNTDLTITGTCSDTGGSGCVGNITKVLTATTTTGSPGTVRDNAGNATVCPANQVANIDKTAPTCASSGGSSTWRNTDLTITGTCSDTGGSGCVGNVSKVITATTAGTSPGTVSDNAGNTATCSNQVANIDKTSPTCSVAKSNTGLTTGVTAIVTGSDTGGSGLASGTGTFNNITSNTNYTVTDGVGNTGTCSITVSSQTQYRSLTCSGFNSCQNSTCACATWGNYTSSVSIRDCQEPGNPGTNQVYIRIIRWGQWTCNCRSNPQPNCTWQVTARSCWYSPGSCEDSCGTACFRNNNPGWPGCGNWYGNDEWANNGTVCESRTYTGTCVTRASCTHISCGCATWGSWSAWSTSTCTPTANQTQCESRIIYN